MPERSQGEAPLKEAPTPLREVPPPLEVSPPLEVPPPLGEVSRSKEVLLELLLPPGMLLLRPLANALLTECTTD